ncbi:MAG: fibronectin type III domain-containing protein, partial [Clostridia bacterium]|nr:fibronectin type III domain-containing protein [Clostridia bacterium]
MTSGGACSEYNEEYFTVGTPPPPVPVFSPDDSNNDGSYSPIVWEIPQTVTITSKPGTTICYMMNSTSYSFDKNTYNALMTQGNTLTLTVDRDMLINVRAYDPENDVYSSVRTSGYGTGNSVRSYVITAPKTLTVDLTSNISSDGMLIRRYDEEYLLDVQSAGAYKITVYRPDLYYYYSNLPVYLYDSQDNVVASLDDYDSVRSNTVTIEKNLSVGTYRLVLGYDRGDYSSNQRYQLTIAKGMEPPHFSEEGGMHDSSFALTLSHPDPNCEIYYKLSYYGEYTKYTEPIMIDRSTDVYAYASSGGTVSDTVNVYYEVDADPPVLDTYYHFYSNTQGTIYASTVLTGQVYIRAINIRDYYSGMDYVYYYLSVNGGEYKKIGSAPWGEDLLWDTTTVTGSDKGPINVRLLPIAFDKVGHASVLRENLNDEYDKDYSPTFKVNNAPCDPMDSFTAEEGISSVTLKWSREKALEYSDSILIYRAETPQALSENLIKNAYYYSSEYSDYFFTNESVSASYYYGISVKDARGVESTMLVTGPVSPVADTKAPTMNIYGVEENEYKSSGDIIIYCYDETAVSSVYAKITASDGTEFIPKNSPWLYEAYHGGYYNCRIYADEYAALDDGAYTLSVTATDVFGQSAENLIHFVKDSTPPAAAVLSTSSIPGKIDLRWTASADSDVIGYNILCSESEDGSFYSVNYSLLTERSMTYPQYEYDYLTPGDVYWFKVQSVDRAGNVGESLPVQGTVGKYNPQIRLVNENPRLGENIKIAFSGFRKSEYVRFYLDRNEEPFDYAYSYNTAEERTVTMNADLSLRGVHTIRAVGESSGSIAQIRFTIADLESSMKITPAVVSGDDSFNIKLDGFPKDKPVYYYINPADSSTSGVPYSYFSTNDSYSGDNYTLSDFGNPLPGTYVLRAVEPQSGLTAFATLTVNSSEIRLICKKDKPSAGEYVNFSVTGFETGDADLYINGEAVGTTSRYYYQTEHSFNVRIPEVSKDVGEILVTAVQPSTGKEVSISVPLSKAASHIEISRENVGFETFTVTGSGFEYYETVKLYVDGVEKSSATNYSDSVSFNYSFDYATKPGRHGIELRGVNSGLTAVGSINFTDSVQTIILSDKPMLYQPLTLYAGGFQPGEKVSFSINDVINGNSNADSSGNASFTVDSLEYSPANGSYTFTATGANSHRVAFYGVSGESGGDLILSYGGNIRSGSTVNITVTGLDAGENADVYINNKAETAITADASGRAVAQFVVPKGYTGNIPVTVRGKTSQKWGTVSVPVTGFNPVLAIAPQAPTAGSTVMVEVTGHIPGAKLSLRFDDFDSGKEVTVASNGTASVNYTIPANVITGEHTISLYEPDSGIILKKSVSISSPSLTLIHPETASPGETVTLGASGLISGEILRISVNGTTVGGALTEKSGSAFTTYTFPHNAAAGNYNILYAFEKIAVIDSASIALTAPVAGVQAAMDGENAAITITAENFIPFEPLSVYFDHRIINDSLESYTTDANGGLTALYTLPVVTFAGDHTIDVFGRTSYRGASAIVNVKETGPVISTTGGAAEGKAGDSLNFEGANFTALGLYDLYFESELLSKGASVDENGEFSGSFIIPDGFADGRYRLIANDTSSGRTAVCYIRIDTTPPGAPELTLFARKQSVVLSWSAPADEDVVSYSLYYRPESGGDYIKLAVLDSTVTTWTHDMRNGDCPIFVDVRYEYIVTATDRLGNEGEGSTAMSAVLAGGVDAPVVTYAYADTGSSIRWNNEYLSTVKGKENTFYVYASDDQEITAIEITAAPENGEFFNVGSPTPVYNGSNGGSSDYRAAMTVDTTVFTDGVYTFRFTAVDSSGNSGSLERKYYIDNTAPAPVTGLNVSGASNSLFVSWSWTPGTTGEVPDRYKVYYSTDANFENYDYINVYAYEGVRNCTIRRLEPDTLYYVRVTAFDVAGNESAWAEGSASPVLDEEKPVITNISPDSQKLGADTSFWIEATDNAEIDWNSVRAEINAGSGGSYIPFGSYSYGAVRANNVNYNGTYNLRFYISDLSGNESEAYEITREFDTFVTAVTGLTASPAAGGIRLTWNRNPDNDLSYYYVYRSEGGDFELKNYLSPLKMTSGDTVTWIDYSTRDDITYTYKIIAVDDINNKSSIDDAVPAASKKGNYDTKINLSPAVNVKPGSVIHISAEGFRGGEYITAYIDDIKDYIFWTYADDSGTVSADWSYVKATDTGSHKIKLVGEYSLAEAEANFTCESVQLPAPPVPESAPGMMEIYLSWEAVDNASYYRVYRSEGASDEVLIADRVYGCSYNDRAVSMTGDTGNIYSYTVSAVDRYGNEGQRSEPTVNRPDADLTDPEIEIFTFQRTGNELRLIAEASDNLRLGKVVFKYKPAESADSSYKNIAEITVNGNEKKSTVNTSFDTSALADGSYTLFVQAVDGAGRISLPVTRTLIISSEAPKAPEELTAVAGQMRITLSWQEPAVQNVKTARYNIYRKSGEGGFTFIASTTLTSYTDLEVKNSETYLYQVTCVSEAETEGPAVTLISRVSPLTDTVPPEITGFMIPDGIRLAGSISLAAAVTDNVGVDHVDFFLISGTEESKIGSSATGAIAVDTREYIKEGTLTFKARAYDAAGNYSESDVSYQVDNAAPGVPVLSVSSSELSVSLKWTMASVPRDLLKYNIYEYNSADNKYRLIGETTSTVFVYNTNVGGSYCVSAVDDLGNESIYSNIESCEPGKDTTAPVINEFLSNDVVRSDAKLTINANDNKDISSYLIEYRPLTTDEITGAVVPKEGTDAPWYVLSTGSWSDLDKADVIGNIKTLDWDTLAVVGTEDGPKAKFPDGLYAFLLTLTDSAGNKSSTEIRVNVANDPPTAPEGFRVDSGEWKLIVSWNPAPGNDASAYALYRKINDGEYELLANTTSNVYVDEGLSPVNQYFYKVAMENDLGKIGPTTEDYSEGMLPPGVKTRPEAETSLPVIMSMSPAQGSRFNAGLNIELQISDNVGLSTVELWKAYIGSSSASQVPADAVYENFATIDASGLNRELVNTSDNDILGTELFVVKTTANTSTW